MLLNEGQFAFPYAKIRYLAVSLGVDRIVLRVWSCKKGPEPN